MSATTWQHYPEDAYWQLAPTDYHAFDRCESNWDTYPPTPWSEYNLWLGKATWVTHGEADYQTMMYVEVA
jgi:hypothetical protein